MSSATASTSCGSSAAIPDPRGPGLDLVSAPSPVDGAYRGRFQPIDAGSYVRVDDTSGLPDGGAFAVAAFVWPTAPARGERRQTVLGWWSEPDGAGFALEIDEAGRLRLRLGAGGRFVRRDLRLRAPRAALALRGGELRRRDRDGPRRMDPSRTLRGLPGRRAGGAKAESSGALPPPGTPVLVGAHSGWPSHGRWMSGAHFNGKVEGPVLVGSAPSPERLRALAERPSAALPEEGLLGAWDFSDGIAGTAVTDRGPHARHGRTVNLPARGVTGRKWDGNVADWRLAPEQYGAIHFHEDDLYDCRWSTDVALEVPADWTSGFYAARMRAPGAVGYVPFFVRPPRGTANAPIALVASTATYMSYANTHIKFDSLNTENLYESLTPISEDELYLNEHRELGLSHYDTHADGSGVFYASRLRPMLNFRPGLYTFNYLNDTHVVAWLDERGFECDVITDEDLHEEGAELLARYRVVITASHPEYTSTRMWDAFDAYQRRRRPPHVPRRQRVLLAHRLQRRAARGHREPARDHRGCARGRGSRESTTCRSPASRAGSGARTDARPSGWSGWASAPRSSTARRTTGGPRRAAIAATRSCSRGSGTTSGSETSGFAAAGRWGWRSTAGIPISARRPTRWCSRRRRTSGSAGCSRSRSS